VTAPADALTAQQIRVLNALRSYVTAHGYAPTLRELGDLSGLTSKSAVSYQLEQLAAKGAIRRVPGAARAVVILDGAGA
jgi:repressor LexA